MQRPSSLPRQQDSRKHVEAVVRAALDAADAGRAVVEAWPRDGLPGDFVGAEECARGEGKIDLKVVFSAVQLQEQDEILSMHYRTLFEKLMLRGVTVDMHVPGSIAEANEASCA